MAQRKESAARVVGAAALVVYAPGQAAVPAARSDMQTAARTAARVVGAACMVVYEPEKVPPPACDLASEASVRP